MFRNSFTGRFPIDLCFLYRRFLMITDSFRYVWLVRFGNRFDLLFLSDVGSDSFFSSLDFCIFITGEVAGRFISGFMTVSVCAVFGTGVATGRLWLLVAPAVADPFA